MLHRQKLALVALATTFAGCASIAPSQQEPVKVKSISNTAVEATLYQSADGKEGAVVLAHLKNREKIARMPCRMAAQKLSEAYGHAINMLGGNRNVFFVQLPVRNPQAIYNIGLVDNDVNMMQRIKTEPCDAANFLSPQEDNDRAKQLRARYEYTQERALARAGIYKA